MKSQWYDLNDYSKPFITGNGFASYCKHVINYNGYQINQNQNNNIYFVKTDHLSLFYDRYRPTTPYKLITHNSDHAITSHSYDYILKDENLICWYAINIMFPHPKLKSIPIGIANHGYQHGCVDTIKQIIDQNNEKTDNVYVNFNLNSNREQRSICLNQTGARLNQPIEDGGWNSYEGGYSQPANFKTYLTALSKSRFCLSPPGGGVDCHRTWEALYLKTIPIVLNYQYAVQHSGVPMIRLDSWEEYKNYKFDQELYDRIWNSYNISDLYLSNYFNSRI